MKHRGMILELVPKGTSVNFEPIVTALARGDSVNLSSFEILHHDSPLDTFREEFIDYLIRFGLTSYLRRQPLLEAVMPPKAQPSGVDAMLRGFIRGLDPTNELVIVDPYFLARTRDVADYVAHVESALQACPASMASLVVVTDSRHVDPVVRTAIEAAVKRRSPVLTLQHRTSDDYHDRFWLNPTTGRGFLTGSSLNGLGKKLAVIDWLDNNDAVDILGGLRHGGLVTTPLTGAARVPPQGSAGTGP